MSNIRPIIYGSTPSRKGSANSPYSATEFPTGLNERELEWRLRRERVDGMNHKFWVSNSLAYAFFGPYLRIVLNLSLYKSPR